MEDRSVGVVFLFVLFFKKNNCPLISLNQWKISEYSYSMQNNLYLQGEVFFLIVIESLVLQSQAVWIPILILLYTSMVTLGST